MCIVSANPCPKCGNRCHHMAGINVPGKAKTDSRYLVCWTCGMMKEARDDAEWQSMKPNAKTKKKVKEDESMGPVFRDWTDAKKRRKQANLASADPTGWHKHTDHHWSRFVDGKKLDYWPSTRKWMYEGRVMHGDLEGFIRKRSD